MAEDIDILEKADGQTVRLKEVTLLMTDPAVIADRKRYEELSREYKELTGIDEAAARIRLLRSNLSLNRSMLTSETDPEMLEMLQEEITKLEGELPAAEEALRLLLVPKDPIDAKNAILEIRAGTGGDEAALFAGDLFKMYSKYAEEQGWKMTATSYSEGNLGGFKEIVLQVEGADVYGTLKYESGVHRVQRIPVTETQGRIQTSAATVAVFPEVDEAEVEIKETDIRLDLFCASGPGGQGVNTTYSAVRMTHLPTGIVVQCQDERSQLKNKAKALAELRARVYNQERQKHLDEIASQRKSMVSTGDRSAKIRTYNFPQGRVTDHRVNLTVYNIQDVLAGHFAPFTEALRLADSSETTVSS